jgi:hypothetical protein
MARERCANYSDSHCLGADVFNTTCRPLAVCLLQEGKPCGYFERCVLPNAKYGNPDFLEAKRTYERTYGPGPSLKACDCGKPVAEGKRVCEACRLQRRKESNREAQRRSRSK